MLELNKLVPGEQLEGRLGNYQIGALLGSGATSYVCGLTDLDNPSRQLVVKVMKQEREREAFMQEEALLREWQRVVKRHVEQCAIFQPATPTAAALDFPFPLPVPYLVEADVKRTQGYLILERVDGKQVTMYLEENGVPLEERFALQIATQFTYLLHLLHTEFKRGFTDMKLEDIWWHRVGRIMVTDWNVVSLEGAVDVQSDILKWGQLLFLMLTGVSLDGSPVRERPAGLVHQEQRALAAGLAGGMLESELQRRAGSHWFKISSGLRAVLCRILHHNPESRYNSAEALYEDLAFLLGIWSEADIEQVEVQLLRHLYREKDANLAAWLFDIAVQRGGLKDRKDEISEAIHALRGEAAFNDDVIASSLIGQNLRRANELVASSLDGKLEPGRRLQALRWRQVIDLVQLGLLQADNNLVKAVAGHIQGNTVEHLIDILQLKIAPGEETPQPLRNLELDAAFHIKTREAHHVAFIDRERELALRGEAQTAFDTLSQMSVEYVEVLRLLLGSHEERLRQLEEQSLDERLLREFRASAARLVGAVPAQLGGLIQEATEALQKGLGVAPNDHELCNIALQASVEQLQRRGSLIYIQRILEATEAALDPDLMTLREVIAALLVFDEALENSLVQPTSWIASFQLRDRWERHRDYTLRLPQDGEDTHVQKLLGHEISARVERFIKQVIAVGIAPKDDSATSAYVDLLEKEANKLLPLLQDPSMSDRYEQELNPWRAEVMRLEARLTQIPAKTVKAYEARQELCEALLDLGRKHNLPDVEKWEKQLVGFDRLLAEVDMVENALASATSGPAFENLRDAEQRWRGLDLAGLDEPGDAPQLFAAQWDAAIQSRFKGIQRFRLLEQLIQAHEELRQALEPSPYLLPQDKLAEYCERLDNRIRAYRYLRRADEWLEVAEKYLEQARRPMIQGSRFGALYAAEEALREADQRILAAKHVASEVESLEVWERHAAAKRALETARQSARSAAQDLIIKDALSRSDAVWGFLPTGKAFSSQAGGAQGEDPLRHIVQVAWAATEVWIRDDFRATKVSPPHSVGTEEAERVKQSGVAVFLSPWPIVFWSDLNGLDQKYIGKRALHWSNTLKEHFLRAGLAFLQPTLIIGTMVIDPQTVNVTQLATFEYPASGIGLTKNKTVTVIFLVM